MHIRESVDVSIRTLSLYLVETGRLHDGNELQNNSKFLHYIYRGQKGLPQTTIAFLSVSFLLDHPKREAHPVCVFLLQPQL